MAGAAAAAPGMAAATVAAASAAASASPAPARTFANMDAFVAHVGARRAVRKVLIANNGIAAVKAIRSIRRWAYETFGNEREVRCT